MFLQKSFFTLLISYCFYILALRDNRIELVRASWKELTISISDVTLSDEGQYTCSLFTMPVKTSKAFLTVLGKTSRRFISLTSSSICAFKVNTLTSDLGSVCSLPSHDLVFFLPFGDTESDVNERSSHWLTESLDVSLLWFIISLCTSHSVRLKLVYHF